MRKKINTDQAGIVAIIVSVILMMLMTLVVVTYSQIINREKRQSLDRELNSQAFYAAESAINTVIAAFNDPVVKAAVNVTSLQSPTGDCNYAINTLTTLSTSVALTGTVRNAISAYLDAIPTANSTSINGNPSTISCLIVNPSVYSYTYGSVDPTASQISHIQSATSGEQINQVEISWQDPSATTPSVPDATTINYKYTPRPNWDPSWPSVLQVDVVPWGASNTADSLMDANQTYFLYPTAGAAAGTTFSGVSSDTNGEVIKATCHTLNQPNYCRATLKVPAGEDFYLRIRPVYRAASVVVMPQTSLGAAIKLKQSSSQGQIVIDVTAKSAGIVKRVSVSNSAASNYLTPDFAVASAATICKRIIINSSGISDLDCGLNNPTPP